MGEALPLAGLELHVAEVGDELEGAARPPGR
jgi:hypothetical protein